MLHKIELSLAAGITGRKLPVSGFVFERAHHAENTAHMVGLNAHWYAGDLVN